jgi:hypothetical protein
VLPSIDDESQTLDIVPDIGSFEISCILSYDLQEGTPCNFGNGKHKEIIEM